jgi:hypothetical protein
VIAWVEGGEGQDAMGPPPAGVELRPWPDDPRSAPDREAVEFAVPRSRSRLALDALPALRVV